MKSLTHVGDAGMAALGQNCPSLTVLDITKTGATDVGIAAIAAGCNNLIRILLSLLLLFLAFFHFLDLNTQNWIYEK